MKQVAPSTGIGDTNSDRERLRTDERRRKLDGPDAKLRGLRECADAILVPDPASGPGVADPLDDSPVGGGAKRDLERDRRSLALEDAGGFE